MTRKLGTVEQIVRFLIAIQLAVAAHVVGHFHPAISYVLYVAAILLLVSTLWQKFFGQPYTGPERRGPQRLMARLRMFRRPVVE